MKHSITGKITSASRRFPPTIFLEQKYSLEPGIKAAIEVRNCGRPGSRKTRSDCAWKPKLGCRGRHWQKDGPLGTSPSYEWCSCQHLLLKPESYLLKLASVRSLLRAKDLSFSVWTCWSDRTSADSCAAWKTEGGMKGAFFPPRVLTAFYFYIFVNRMLYLAAFIPTQHNYFK